MMETMNHLLSRWLVPDPLSRSNRIAKTAAYEQMVPIYTRLVALKKFCDSQTSCDEDNHQYTCTCVAYSKVSKKLSAILGDPLPAGKGDSNGQA